MFVTRETYEAIQAANGAAEQPQPDHCYCHLLKGGNLCQSCDADYVRWSIEEVYGQRCTPILETNVTLGPLDVLALKDASDRPV